MLQVTYTCSLPLDLPATPSSTTRNSSMEAQRVLSMFCPSCSGVPCLHEETLHAHSENWQFSSLVLNDSESQPSLSPSQTVNPNWEARRSFGVLPLIQTSEKQTKPSHTQRISDRTPHPFLGHRAAVTPASSSPPMLPEQSLSDLPCLLPSALNGQ